MARKLGIALAVACVALAATTGTAGAVPPTLSLNKTFVTGLDHPWDMGFLSDGTMFFTERSGPVSVRLTNGTINEIVTPSNVLDQGGEGGMLGLAVDPKFAANSATSNSRFIYACYSSNLDGDAAGPTDNRLVRFEVNATLDGVVDRTAIVEGMPHNKNASGRHSGCRPRFKPGSSPPALFVGTGDAAMGTVPQDTQSLGGKILRVTRNGNAYPGNPGGGWDARIFNIGHRNVQGIAFEPETNRGYSVEHGPGKNDEVNRIKKGANYGWDPIPGYNESVSMTDRNKYPDAVKAVWKSGNITIAPSGATFLEGAQWEGWDGRLALAVLDFNSSVGQHLRILKVRANGTINKEKDIEVFADENTRLRSAVQGPDGLLYIATDGDGPTGAIWKVTPS
jgi:glucose/arabinose dehydrogenase